MVKKRRTGGLIHRKEDNFQYVIFAGEWQGEIDDFWRESLQNSQIKVEHQLLMLPSGELITTCRDFQLFIHIGDGVLTQ